MKLNHSILHKIAFESMMLYYYIDTTHGGDTYKFLLTDLIFQQFLNTLVKSLFKWNYCAFLTIAIDLEHKGVPWL